MIQVAADLQSILILGALASDEVHVADRREDLDRAMTEAEEKVRAAPPPDGALVRAMYHRLGLDPTRTRPSSEALLRRVRRGEPLPRINTLVDICNWCSLELQVPYGLYDRARIEGPIELRLGTAGRGVRRHSEGHGEPGRPDDAGRFGGPVRQSQRRLAPHVGDGRHDAKPGRHLRAPRARRGVGARGSREDLGARHALRRRQGGRKVGCTMRWSGCAMKVVAIIAAGGRGQRMGGSVPKQLLDLGGRSILQRSLDVLDRSERIDEIVDCRADRVGGRSRTLHHGGKTPVVLAPGGDRRQDSVANALRSSERRYRCRGRPRCGAPVRERGSDCQNHRRGDREGAAVAALAARDTVKRAQAGAGSSRDRGNAAAGHDFSRRRRRRPSDTACSVMPSRSGAPDVDGTDEAELAESAGHAVRLVEGEPRNVKITTADDSRRRATSCRRLVCRPPSRPRRHRLRPAPCGGGRPLLLGGILVPVHHGLAGHSDADVAVPCRHGCRARRRRGGRHRPALSRLGRAMEGRVEPRSAAAGRRARAGTWISRRQRRRRRHRRAAEAGAATLMRCASGSRHALARRPTASA